MQNHNYSKHRDLIHKIREEYSIQEFLKDKTPEQLIAISNAINGVKNVTSK